MTEEEFLARLDIKKFAVGQAAMVVDIKDEEAFINLAQKIYDFVSEGLSDIEESK